MGNGEIHASTNLRMEHSFYLSPKMLNSLHILQMDSLSLEKHIAEQVLENPVLEYPAAYRKQPQKISWEEILHGDSGGYDTLEFFLRDQLSRLKLPPKIRNFCRMLTRFVDGNGYLQTGGIPESCLNSPLFPQALQTLQSLEPPGVCARDLKECLLLQLQRTDQDHPLAAVLIDNYLEDVSKRSFAKILKATGAPPEELQDALQTILQLNPRPGAAFISRNKTAYLHPDFILSVQDDHIEVIQEERSFPSLAISDYYVKLYRTTEDPEVRQYLQERVTAAKQLVMSLENRKTTTRRCLEAILQFQKGFFLNPSRQLVPLTLEKVARAVDLHSSTVSRAISGKYLEFEGKVYPLKKFFARSIRDTGEQVVASQIRELIRQIIGNEDPNAPMSDQQIVWLLQQSGNSVSRRTVAKYREQMGILSSKQRRKL